MFLLVKLKGVIMGMDACYVCPATLHSVACFGLWRNGQSSSIEVIALELRVDACAQTFSRSTPIQEVTWAAAAA